MQLEKDYKRIVVKIGSSLLFAQEAYSDCLLFPMDKIAEQISDLIKNGEEIVIVSSGAIASGMRLLKMKSRPKELSYLQAVAAVGQHLLMSQYRRFFDMKKINCAQLLLTWDDFDNRKRYLNAKNTLLTLLKLGILPIINENDTVATEEIKFGDNDRLSALVSKLISADILLILSDIDGLFDKDKKVIRVVKEITPQIKELASPSSNKTSVGGMTTKIEAAKIAVDSGIPCVIANGRRKDIILSAIRKPEKYGTLFIPKKGLTAKEHWIAFGSKPKGKVFVDNGAKEALTKGQKSLLSVGITKLEGKFNCGDVVSIMDQEDREFARGVVGCTSNDLDKIKGKHHHKEIVHRNNLVIL